MSKMTKKIKNDLGVQGQILSTANGRQKYLLYLDRFLEISLGQITWKNLPKEIDERYLELSLFKNGSALFFYDDVIGYIAIGSTAYGKWSIYGIPEERTGYGANGAQFKRNSKDSVIIWNKLSHTSDIDLLSDYASKLALLDDIVMMNANAQKTPILIKCNEAQRLTLIHLYEKYVGSEPFIFADEGLDSNAFQILGTGAPFTADKIYELKTQIWNEALTYLGVVNITTTSRERLISDQVEKAMGGTMASRQTRLKARKQACKEINEMFGLNVDVKFVDSNEKEEKIVSRETTGEDNDGELYNEGL